jgi:putative two-component system response regulator
MMELRFSRDVPHLKRVGRLSEQIARALRQEESEVDLIGMVSPLYDLGRLCEQEDAVEDLSGFSSRGDVRTLRHTMLGESIIGTSTSPLLREIKIVAKHHHERWDGTGFPDGLKAEEIPLCCRITAVAVAFDRLTHSEMSPMTKDDALKEVQRLGGSFFDPKVVGALVTANT